MYIGSERPWINHNETEYGEIGEKTDQWQKSLETTQNVSSLFRKGARSSPYCASDRWSMAPTKTGTILMSCLTS